MKNQHLLTLAITTFMLMAISCNNENNTKLKKEPKLKEETVTYTVDSLTMNSFVVYDENTEGERPEYW